MPSLVDVDYTNLKLVINQKRPKWQKPKRPT